MEPELETTKRTRAARTLTAGQRLLIRNLAEHAAAWVRAGRRDDLDGVAAILGCILRLVLLGAGAYGAWLLVRRWPAVLWAVVPLWCWAAVRAIPDEDEEEGDAKPSPTAPRDAVLRLLYDALGDRPAMHLSEVLQHLQEKGHGKAWKVSDLRARLEAVGIPIELKLKVGKKGPTRGVVKANLPPLPDAASPETSTAPSTAA
ncbi:hypothetical protein OOK13_40315 [Streptomyces sp. NBC_00378]|uniref:hypothetical protein n=1 Tax=unclassified Streptomyces TaxID=2593676 RepID=UPI00225686AB|nr:MULTISPECIES: hypothetical protein [unclassified Streptomyces]MCX5112198.1 hypothetical protein [Streptomyces sp. NBC_00378]MCX5114607.1 hypothetical protein [Streptomyces sp. NBC_00378]